MEIKKVGFASFKLEFNEVTFITDPLLSEKAGDKFSSQECDAVLFSENQYVGQHQILKNGGFGKISPKRRESFMEISSPGDYEVGGVIVRRKIDSNFYILDEGDVRIVYFGAGFGDIKIDKLNDLGDVDVLILPVPGTEPFATYEQSSKVISNIDPTKLIPSMFANGVKLSPEFKEVKDVAEFIKYAGYTHVTEDKKTKVVKGVEDDNKVMEVVILK